MGLRSGLSVGPLTYSTPILVNHVFIEFTLCTGHCHVETDFVSFSFSKIYF